MTARERFDAMVRDEMGPWLRGRGFKKRRNRFRRADDAGWQVVDFQASQFGSRDDVRFTINLGVGVPELAESRPADDVQIGVRIGVLTDDGQDRWWAVDVGTDVARLAEELRAILEHDALPWLEARSDFDQLVLLARQRPTDFPAYLLGRFEILLARSGFAELAAEVRQIASRSQI